MEKLILFFALVFTSYLSNAQAGIGTKIPDASAALEVQSLNKGVLLSRIALKSTTDVATIKSAANSLIVYNTATVADITPGYYYWNINSSLWVRMLDQTNTNSWITTGNAGTDPTMHFIGTTDNQDLVFKRNNQLVGKIGTNNISFGLNALINNSTGILNIAIGGNTLNSNSTGTNNIAIGNEAMSSNSKGTSNIAIGNAALSSNSEGTSNIAIGGEALSSNSTGTNNIATGTYALFNNTGGGNNIGIGFNSLFTNDTGNNNIAIGNAASMFLYSGDNNIAIGNASGYNGGPTAAVQNTIAIGFGAEVTTSNTIRLGNSAITDIYANTTLTSASDIRYKENIKTMPLGLAFINKIRPVEYTRKNETAATKEWGVIAQELQQTLTDENYTNAGIVQNDGSADKMLSVRYTDLIAPMIKAMQELSEQNKQLQEQNNQLQLEVNEIKRFCVSKNQ